MGSKLRREPASREYAAPALMAIRDDFVARRAGRRLTHDFHDVKMKLLLSFRALLLVGTAIRDRRDLHWRADAARASASVKPSNTYVKFPLLARSRCRLAADYVARLG